jgi:hypothetical protein
MRRYGHNVRKSARETRRHQVPDEAEEATPVEARSIEVMPVEQRVRDHVTALDDIEDVPLAEHAKRYGEVHAALQAALVEIDGESG